MSESGFEVGGATVALDPCPDDASLVLDALIASATDDDELEPWRLTDKGLLAELERMQLAATRQQVRWLALLAEAERREVTLRQVGLPTADWLADRNSHWARSAREEVRLAVRLDAQPRVAEAMAEGGLSLEQAKVIVHGLDRLPPDLDSEQREAAATRLVEWGREFGPYGLSRLVNRVVEVVAPEVAEDADRRAVERIEAEQARDRYLAWSKDADGAFVLRGKFGKVAGQQLVGALRSVASRQRKAARAAGEEMSWTQAQADALVELADHFGSCKRPPRLACDADPARPGLCLSRLRSGPGGVRGAPHRELVPRRQDGTLQWRPPVRVPPSPRRAESQRAARSAVGDPAQLPRQSRVRRTGGIGCATRRATLAAAPPLRVLNGQRRKAPFGVRRRAHRKWLRSKAPKACQIGPYSVPLAADVGARVKILAEKVPLTAGAPGEARTS